MKVPVPRPRNTPANITMGMVRENTRMMVPSTASAPAAASSFLRPILSARMPPITEEMSKKMKITAVR